MSAVQRFHRTKLPWFVALRRQPAEAALLLAITLVAAALRFYRLGDWSLWGDEMFTLRFAPDGFRAPLSSQLIFALTRWLGTTEWSARLVPALIGSVTIPILYLPVRRGFGRPVALVFSLLLAVSTWHLYWSQNVRFYSTLLLFFSLALFCWFFALDEDRPWLAVISLVFLGLAANERLVALFFAPIAAAYVGLLYLLPARVMPRPRGLRWRNLAIYLVPGLVLTLFLAGPYLLSLDQWMIGFGNPNNTPQWIVGSFVYYTGLPVVIMGLFGAAHLVRERRHAALLFGLAALGPLLALGALAPFHYTANRYAFVSLTSWILLCSVALVQLYEWASGRGRLLAVGVLLTVVALALSENYLYFSYQHGNRADARAAFQYVRQHRQASDVVVAFDRSLGAFYLDDDVYGLRSFDFSAIPPGAQRVWIVEDMIAAGKLPAQHAWLQSNALPVADFDVHFHARTYSMRVYLYAISP
jgi:4-amino-4-deoxy-L-arabinose transferase-like glycosyltransferase